MLKALILFLLALNQVKLIYTGDILYFLAPGMLGFFYFSTFGFLVLAAYKALSVMVEQAAGSGQAACGCHQEHESPAGRVFMYLLFSGLILAGLLTPPRPLDSSLARKKGIIYQQVKSSETRDQEAADQKDSKPMIDHEWWEEYEFETDRSQDLQGPQKLLKKELGIWYDQEYYSQLPDRLLAQDVIKAGDKDFLDVLLVISAYLDRFQGKKIELVGFVYRDRNMNKNELALTRTAITCCLADAFFYGVLVRGDSLSDFAEDTWLKVVGRVGRKTENNQDMPAVDVLSVQEISPPSPP
ncbi:MAG: TIGR03943 family putative permease subunit, partial [Desulfonatronovibrionaceae bacterium]